MTAKWNIFEQNPPERIFEIQFRKSSQEDFAQRCFVWALLCLLRLLNFAGKSLFAAISRLRAGITWTKMSVRPLYIYIFWIVVRNDSVGTSPKKFHIENFHKFLRCICEKICRPTATSILMPIYLSIYLSFIHLSNQIWFSNRWRLLHKKRLHIRKCYYHKILMQ